MPQLMPPLALNNLLFFDPINSPQMPLRLIQKDALKDMPIIRQRRLAIRTALPELMLVVRAIKGHLDLLRIGRVRVGVVHGAEPAGLAAGAARLVFGERDLGPLGVVLGLGAQRGLEAGFVHGGKVLAVGVGDGDVVVEAGAAEDEAFAPGGPLRRGS